MNYLICSAGRRCNLVLWFKQELNKRDKKIFVTDQDTYAPALYYADDYFVLENDNGAVHYINALIHICKDLNISNVISLHDFQIIDFTRYKDMFDNAGINILHNDIEIQKLCLDKSRYNELPINQVPTFIVKNRHGSASMGVEKVKQPLLQGKEYNIQCYFDIHTKELLEIFIQEKLTMRSGETERSISKWNIDIANEIKKLDGLFKGVVDIDVIYAEKVYIIDINPRFGGGYPLAHHCEKNYIEKLIDNVDGKGMYRWKDYKTNVVMMKFNGLFFKDNK